MKESAVEMMDEDARSEHPVDEMVADLRMRQRNTLFPDGKAAGSDVDGLLWRGAEKLPMVQRAGIAFFGLFFLIAAISFAAMAAERHSILLGLFSVGWLFIGARILLNSIPKRKPTSKVN